MVLGASFDTVEEQKAFAVEQDFGFRLLSDPDRVMGRAYAAARPAADPLAAFPYRYTYLVSPEGTVAAAYDLGSSPALDQHAAQVLADIEALG